MQLKKYYPFVVPTIALLLILFLAFRWYNLRTQRDNGMSQTDVEIENLTDEEIEIVQGADDVSTVNLEPQDEQALAMGQVRYKLQNDRVLLNVSAELEQLDSGAYQVWVRSEGAETAQKAFELAYGKGGYTGSASLSADNLPLEVIVTKESNASDDEMEVEILQGTVEATE